MAQSPKSENLPPAPPFPASPLRESCFSSTFRRSNVRTCQRSPSSSFLPSHSGCRSLLQRSNVPTFGRANALSTAPCMLYPFLFFLLCARSNRCVYSLNTSTKNGLDKILKICLSWVVNSRLHVRQFRPSRVPKDSLSRHSSLATRHCFCPFCPLVSLLFPINSKLPLLQLLCFDNHANCRGWVYPSPIQPIER